MGFNDINLQVSGPQQPASTYKTKVLKGQVPFATQVTEPNTKYVIKHNFVLNGDVTIPENCILEFDGGSISGEFTIDLNFARIIGERCLGYQIKLENVEDIIEFDWFKNEKLLGDTSVYNNIIYNDFINGITNGTPTTVPLIEVGSINSTICENNIGKIRFGSGIYPFDKYITTPKIIGNGKWETLLWFPKSKGVQFGGHNSIENISIEAKDDAVYLYRADNAVSDVYLKDSSIISYTENAICGELHSTIFWVVCEDVCLRGGAGKASMYNVGNTQVGDAGNTTTIEQVRVMHGTQFFNLVQTNSKIAAMKACYYNCCAYLEYCSVDAGIACDYVVYYDNNFGINNGAFMTLYHCIIEANHCKGVFRNESDSPIDLRYGSNEVYGTFDLEYGVQIYSPYALIKLRAQTKDFGDVILARNLSLTETYYDCVLCQPTTKNLANCPAVFFVIPSGGSSTNNSGTLIHWKSTQDAQKIVNLIGLDRIKLNTVQSLLTYFTGNQYQYLYILKDLQPNIFKVNKDIYTNSSLDGTPIKIVSSGTFANKPSSKYIPEGYGYFCTDKQTAEGQSNGIMIYLKSTDNTDPDNPVDIWVDALGRVVS